MINVLPIIISIIVFLAKMKFVNCKSGKKFATRELIIDISKLVAINIAFIVANISIGKEFSFWALLIDLVMLVAYIITFSQENYAYDNRKAVTGILSSIVMLLSISITILKMILGKYNAADTTLAQCFTKGALYYIISAWGCFSSNEKGLGNKIKAMFKSLINSFKNYNMTSFDYYEFAFIGLFFFQGCMGNILPIGVFGIHEILNKKFFKGFIYIILGNIFIFMKNHLYPVAEVLCFIYVIVALLDLIIGFAMNLLKRSK